MYVPLRTFCAITSVHTCRPRCPSLPACLPQTKEETIRKYRQWLGALLECTTKLSAGRAAAAAAEAEVKQREGDLALLNEEVASFMSKARWVMTKRLLSETDQEGEAV